jgi:hypothetical protein
MCRHKRDVVSGTGSRFLLCRLSAAEGQFAKYPPQPVTRCVGYAAATDRGEGHAPPDRSKFKA